MVVREAGLEPARREPIDFKSIEFTNFSTLATLVLILRHHGHVKLQANDTQDSKTGHQ